mgnify:CR=1 FL=1
MAEINFDSCTGCVKTEGLASNRRLLKECKQTTSDGNTRLRWTTTGSEKRTVLRTTPTGREYRGVLAFSDTHYEIDTCEVLLWSNRSRTPAWYEWRINSFLGPGDAKDVDMTRAVAVMGDYAYRPAGTVRPTATCCCKDQKDKVHTRHCSSSAFAPAQVITCKCACLPGESEVKCSSKKEQPAGSVFRELVEIPDPTGRDRYLWVIRQTRYDKASRSHVPTGGVITVLTSTVIGGPRSGTLEIDEELFEVTWEMTAIRRTDSNRVAWIERRVSAIKRAVGAVTKVTTPFVGRDDGDRTGEQCVFERDGVKIPGTLVCTKDPQSGVYSCSCVGSMPHLRDPNPPASDPA